MDYKKVAELIKWHATYSRLSGAEARVIMLMATSANHVSSKMTTSYSELAETLGLSRAAVIKAIASLIKQKAIYVDEQATGRSNTTYKVHTADELTDFFVQESINPQLDQWRSKMEDLFSDVLDKEQEIGADCNDCDVDNEKYCHIHQAQLNLLKKTQKYRDYQLWLIDNPRPNYTIKTIRGIKVR